jgi:fucose permease
LLYIPYMVVAFVVLTLSIIFFFSYIPDVKTKDDYHLDEKDEAAGKAAPIERDLHRGLIYLLLFFNTSVLVCVVSIFLWLILSAFDNIGDKLVGLASIVPISSYVRITSENSLLIFICEVACVLLVISAFFLIPAARKVTHHSIWSHPHFSGATFAQFLYVAAQAGIFSFFINYMTAEVPPIPGVLQTNTTKEWIGVKTALANEDVKDLTKLAERLEKQADPISEYVYLNLSPSTLRSLAEFKASSGDNVRGLRSLLVLDMNMLINQDPHKVKKEKKSEDGKKETEEEKVKREKKEKIFYDPAHFAGIKLSDKTQLFLAQKLKEDQEYETKKAALEKMSDEEKTAAKAKTAAEKEKGKEPEKINTPLLNRMLLQDSFSGMLNYQEDVLTFTEKGAAFLLTIGFICFLTGRFTGAAMMRKYSAHKILCIFGVMNVFMCLVIFAKLGWLSVLCVFLSFYFMSIMFPTIFALGIFGLGARAKKASAFLVMAIMGGAVLPKLMGQVADLFDMSRGFIVPLGCFALIGLYGFLWPKFSGAESLSGVKTSGGH